MFFFILIIGMFFYIVKLLFQLFILILQCIFSLFGLIFDIDWFGGDYS